MDSQDLVRVAVYTDETEARMAMAFLEENGIRVSLSGAEVSAFGMAIDGPDDIELIIAKSDFEKAEKLLEEFEMEDEDPVPAWTCKCGEDVDEGFGVCWSCGEPYPG